MLLLALIAALALLAASLRVVPAGYATGVYRFGRFHRALGPGWHVLLPLVDRLGRRVDMVGHRVSTELAEPQAARAEVYFQILEPGRVGAGLERVDALVGKRASDCLASLRGEPGSDPSRLAEGLKLHLNDSLRGLGLYVTRCQLR